MSTAAALARRPESWRQDAFVAVATVAAGVFGYAFSLVLSHSLGPAGFGELSALLAVVVLASVPGVALQAGIARGIAAHPHREDATRVFRQTAVVALAVGVALLLALPLLQLALDVRSWSSLLLVCAIMVPTTVSYGCLGTLQGRRRFVALGTLLVLVQLAKLAGGLVAATTGSGITGALLGTAVLTTVVALGGVVALLPRHRPALTLRFRVAAREVSGLRGVFARDAVAMLGVLLLTNLDLVLARHYLPSHQAGLYAAGNLVTKVAFWGPSFVSTVAYPRLARVEERASALRRGAVLLGAFAVASAVGALVCAPLVPVVVGAAYRPVEPLVWLFALQGAALAAVLLGVYAGVAVNDRRPAVLVWLVAAGEAAAVALRWHASMQQVLGVVLCGSATLVLATVWRYRGALAPVSS